MDLVYRGVVWVRGAGGVSWAWKVCGECGLHCGGNIFVSENLLLQGESIQTSLLSIQIGKYENALLF